MELYISGMDCPSCAKKVEELIKKEKSVETAHIEFVSRKLTVTFDEKPLSQSRLVEIIESLGYEVQAGSEKEPSRGKNINFSYLLCFLSAIFTVTGLVLFFAKLPPLYSTVFYGLAIVSGGSIIFPKAFLSVRRLNFDINFLMSMAIFGAISLGEWSEAAVAVFLYSLANILERGSMDRARSAIANLMDLAPKTAYVKKGDSQDKKAVRDIRKGEIIVIKPGDTIPLDGIVISGHSDVSESPITGENLSVQKEKDSTVYAGTVNGEGSLEVEVTAEMENTTLSGIVRMVEKARAEKAPLERTIDAFARYYTPVVILIAFFVVVVPSLFGLGGFREWFYRGLVILVVSCPCALIISTPVTVLSGLSRAARLGILVKGGSFLEWAGKLKVIAFDKTGTITEGRPVLKSITTVGNMEEKELLRLAASIEAGSEHQIARTIREAATDRGLGLLEVEKFRVVRGKGAEAVIDGKKYYLGSHRMICELEFCDGSIHPELERMENEALTTALLSDGVEVMGIFTVADKIRDNAAKTVKELSDMGVSSVMLTGDTRGSALAVSEAVGITDCKYELLPADKVKAVEELNMSKGYSAMVGDGINDAPAMTAAHIGISMGAVGTDLALETSDVMLLGDDLSRLPRLISLSRAAVAIIGQNVFFSFALKLMVLALAVNGTATLWMAIAADMGSSLIVTFNGLRVLRK